MSTTQPIKTMEDIEEMKQYFYRNGEMRNYALVTMGINTALRISDLLKLRWDHVWNFEKQCYKSHIVLQEQKTGKTANVFINEQCRKCLGAWKQQLKGKIYPAEYIFKSRMGNNKPIGRNRAYIIIKNASQALGYEGNISCHSLRKTFGYHAWKQGISPTIIMSIYNHSSMEVTKRYLSIDQDDKDEVYKNIILGMESDR